ncbi:MAG: hypothetical protein U5J98_04625 [Halobacteriales archaeon]|nr:hypothetical protein [Halobacteriales archaeon]
MFTYLQIGNAGGTNLVSVGVIVLIIAAVVAYWVYKDATGRGRDNAALWALGIGILTLLTLIGGLIGLGVYIYTRN